MNLIIISSKREYQQYLGLKNKHLEGRIGSKGYVSSILNKRKPLTLKLARFFHHELGIPADVLLS